jgi:hypothetical protein
MNQSPETGLESYLLWVALAIAMIGSSAALGGALFSGVGSLLRIRDSSFALVGRVTGVLTLLWFFGPSAVELAVRIVPELWRAGLAR